MAHQIGKTRRITLEGRTFELEQKTHHRGKPYAECKADCPKGWTIPEYWLLQNIRNSSDRNKFNLLNTQEYVRNPDRISRRTGFVARFDAYPDGANLDCGWDPTDYDPLLGVRYVRKIPQAKTS